MRMPILFWPIEAICRLQGEDHVGERFHGHASGCYESQAGISWDKDERVLLHELLELDQKELYQSRRFNSPSLIVVII